jgi:hypothetical protein
VLGLIGCGGGGAKFRIDDKLIVQISVDDKQGVFAAETEMNQAKGEMDKAKADLEAINHDLDIANNELKTAKLRVETAKLSVKGAEASADVNRKAIANKDLKVAELEQKQADAKVDWLEKKKKWIKECYDAAETHHAAADSHRELEKAKVAQKHGIKPSENFNLSNFEIDNLDKQKSYTEARLQTDKRKAQVDELERKYLEKKADFERARAGG